MEKAKTRFISSFIVEFISEFMCYCQDSLDIAVEDFAILCLVASESTREIRNDDFVKNNFGKEDWAFPSIYRPAVSVKYVQTRLKFSRETARRKLESLVERKFLDRIKGGYVFAAQTGGDDYTKHIRLYLTNRLETLKKYAEDASA